VAVIVQIAQFIIAGWAKVSVTPHRLKARVGFNRSVWHVEHIGFLCC
jgi:hypothetical protein